MSRKLLLMAVGAALRASTLFSAEPITLTFPFASETGARDGCGEIVAYTPHGHTVLTTLNGGDGVGAQILKLSATGELSERAFLIFGTLFGESHGAGMATSVAADPRGRGFGAVCLVPPENGEVRGKVAFFDYGAATPEDRRVVATIDVGYHPDSILFSPDGTLLCVANEGEFTVGGSEDAPGSVTFIDLSEIRKVADLANLSAGDVVEIDFSPDKLAHGADLKRVRLNDVSSEALAHRELHVEPETMCLIGNMLYVSLQENNSIGVMKINREELSASRWRDIHNLGEITNIIDASKNDGPNEAPAAIIDDPVKGLPMPDGIAAFERNGRRYIVTANEGDFRPDDGDRVRVRDFDQVEAAAAHLASSLGDLALGKLRVLAFECDADGDGALDDIISAGTRSMSVWDAESGALIADTGSLETLLLRYDPKHHNIENGNEDAFDERSRDKGPEPEALTLAEIDDRLFAIIAMERQNGIVVFDISDPEHPTCQGYINSIGNGLVAPESLIFVPANESPTGSNLVLVGYEGGGGGIGVYSLGLTLQGRQGESDN